MLVSIVIPVYNAEKHLLRCLKSVASQTYREIECLLVEDKSSDDSHILCQSYINTYKGDINFCLLPHSANRGVAAARNTGTLNAKGDFIFYMDSDDELPTDAIEALVKHAVSHPEAELIFGNITIAKGTEQICSAFEVHELLNNQSVRSDFFSSRRKCYCVVWNKLIRRDFIQRNHLSFREGIIHEDELWMYHAAMNAASFLFLDKPTYIQHVTSTSIMSTLTQSNNTRCWMIVLEEVLQQMASPCYEEQVLKYLNILLTQCQAEFAAGGYVQTVRAFAIHSLKIRLYRLFIALTYFQWSVNRHESEGIKNWLYHYSANRKAFDDSLVKAIYYDFRAVVSLKMKNL